MPNFVRQLDILDPSELIYPVSVIGIGGIGSPASFELAKMGVRSLTLFDPDRVEAHNRPSQLFRRQDEVDSNDPEGRGRLKVEVMAEIIGEFAEWCRVVPIPEAFQGQKDLEGIVISGVDRMEIDPEDETVRWGRKEIWERVRNNVRVSLYIDGRLGGEVLQVFTIRPNHWQDIEAYEESLFPEQEMMRDSCTAQGIIYTGFGIASFIASQLKKWLKQEPYPFGLTYNFKSGILILE